MFLVIASIVLVVVAICITWSTAFAMANPSAPRLYSKTVGWVAGAAGIPFFGAALYCAVKTQSESLPVIVGVIGLVGMLIASPFGEARGDHKKSTS